MINLTLKTTKGNLKGRTKVYSYASKRDSLRKQ
jgi:hypothetical protein